MTAPDRRPLRSNRIPQTATQALRWVARIVQAPLAAPGFAPSDFGGHSLKRAALRTDMQAGAHAAQLTWLGRHKNFDVLGECRPAAGVSPSGHVRQRGGKSVGLRWPQIMRRRWKSGWQSPPLAAV